MGFKPRDNSAGSAALITRPAVETLRPRIRRSWLRSSLSGVNHEMGMLAVGTSDVEVDSGLYWAAEPAINELEGKLTGIDLVTLLSDNTGRLLCVRASAPTIHNQFEKLGTRPGASACEEKVGTNAIGTAIEEGQPIAVVGSEHYQQTFERYACAAAVIRNPMTRRTLGGLAFATLAPDVSDRIDDLLTLIVQTAGAVEQRLLEQASATDRLLLAALKARGCGTRRAIVAVSRGLMIANDPGVRLLPRLDQALLLERARETIESGNERVVDVALGTEADPLTVRCIPVHDAGGAVGALLDFGSGDAKANRQKPLPASPQRILQARPAQRSTDLIACRSPEAHSLQQRIAAAATRGSVLVAGEPGSGKTTTARAVLALRFPDSEPTVIDCAARDVTDEFVVHARAGNPVVLSHLELLEAAIAYRLRDQVRRMPELQDSVVATANTSTLMPSTDNPLVDEFSVTRLDVPCLRFRRDDIRPLAEYFAAQATARHQRLRPEAEQIMLRYPWPGNIRELRRVIEGATLATRGDIALEDLPAELRKRATRRPLGLLEQAEADAILTALHACGNNKVQAAALLQISRSRLYRKVSAYGLAGALLD